jgi:hypothetical protein
MKYLCLCIKKVAPHKLQVQTTKTLPHQYVEKLDVMCIPLGEITYKTHCYANSGFI